MDGDYATDFRMGASEKAAWPQLHFPTLCAALDRRSPALRCSPCDSMKQNGEGRPCARAEKGGASWMLSWLLLWSLMSSTASGHTDTSSFGGPAHRWNEACDDSSRPCAMSVRRNSVSRQHRPGPPTNPRSSPPSSSASYPFFRCTSCFRLPLLLALLVAACALIKGPWSSFLPSTLSTSFSSAASHSSYSSPGVRQQSMAGRVWRFLDPTARTLLAKQGVSKGDIHRGSWEDKWLASKWELQDRLTNQWGRARLGGGHGGVSPNLSRSWHTEFAAVMDLREAAE